MHTEEGLFFVMDGGVNFWNFLADKISSQWNEDLEIELKVARHNQKIIGKHWNENLDNDEKLIICANWVVADWNIVSPNWTVVHNVKFPHV